MAEQKLSDGFITVGAAAKRLGVSIKTIYKLWHSGDIPGIRVGAAIRINASALEAWILGNSNTTPIHVEAKALERTPSRFKHLPPSRPSD